MDIFRISPAQLWMNAAILASVDGIYIFVLSRHIKSGRFREIRWFLVASAAISWGIFSIVLVSVFWESYYQYFYPSWLRSVWLLVFVPILYGALAMVFHWLALHIPGNPIFNFCVLVGIEAVLEHTWGIYGLHILKIPLLQDVNLASILVFSVPEYIFYWCIVITIAILIYNIRIGKKK